MNGYVYGCTRVHSHLCLSVRTRKEGANSSGPLLSEVTPDLLPVFLCVCFKSVMCVYSHRPFINLVMLINIHDENIYNKKKRYIFSRRECI